MTPQALPLFPPAATPHARASLDGWKYGDAALLVDERNLGHWRKARVIGVGMKSHVLTLRAEKPDCIVTVQMPHFKNKLRRPE